MNPDASSGDVDLADIDEATSWHGPPRRRPGRGQEGVGHRAARRARLTTMTDYFVICSGSVGPPARRHRRWHRRGRCATTVSRPIGREGDASVALAADLDFGARHRPRHERAGARVLPAREALVGRRAAAARRVSGTRPTSPACGHQPVRGWRWYHRVMGTVPSAP